MQLLQLPFHLLEDIFQLFSEIELHNNLAYVCKTFLALTRSHLVTKKFAFTSKRLASIKSSMTLEQFFADYPGIRHVGIDLDDEAMDSLEELLDDINHHCHQIRTLVFDEVKAYLQLDWLVAISDERHELSKKVATFKTARFGRKKIAMGLKSLSQFSNLKAVRINVEHIPLHLFQEFCLESKNIDDISLLECRAEIVDMVTKIMRTRIRKLSIKMNLDLEEFKECIINWQYTCQCSQLNRLELTDCLVDNYAFRALACLPMLEHFIVNGTIYNNRQNFVTIDHSINQSLEPVFSNHLKSLRIGEISCLSDQTWSYMFRIGNSLQHLEIVLRCKLTIVNIEALLLHCPNLKSLKLDFQCLSDKEEFDRLSPALPTLEAFKEGPVLIGAFWTMLESLTLITKLTMDGPIAGLLSLCPNINSFTLDSLDGLVSGNFLQSPLGVLPLQKVVKMDVKLTEEFCGDIICQIGQYCPSLRELVIDIPKNLSPLTCSCFSFGLTPSMLSHLIKLRVGAATMLSLEDTRQLLRNHFRHLKSFILDGNERRAPKVARILLMLLKEAQQLTYFCTDSEVELDRALIMEKLKPNLKLSGVTAT